MANWVMLPWEIIKLSLLNLPPPEIFKFCSINTHMYRLYADDIFWYEVANKYFPLLSPNSERWYNLVLRLCEPKIIPLVQFSFTYGNKNIVDHIKLDKFTTVEDLYRLCEKMVLRLSMSWINSSGEMIIRDFHIGLLSGTKEFFSLTDAKYSFVIPNNYLYTINFTTIIKSRSRRWRIPNKDVSLLDSIIGLIMGEN